VVVVTIDDENNNDNKYNIIWLCYESNLSENIEYNLQILISFRFQISLPLQRSNCEKYFQHTVIQMRSKFLWTRPKLNKSYIYVSINPECTLSYFEDKT
jgi:hypothetical protein